MKLILIFWNSTHFAGYAMLIAAFFYGFWTLIYSHFTSSIGVLKDAYEEALDLAVYLKNAIIEQQSTN